MRENKWLTWAAEFIITFLVAGILVLLVLSFLPGCRSVRTHKEQSTKTIDSVHLLNTDAKTVVKFDSSVHSDKKDSGTTHTLWNYEKETTNTVDWFFLPGEKRFYPDPLPGDTTHPPASGQLVARSTTTTKERGNQDIMETHHNTAGLQTDWSFLDSSSSKVQKTDQVKGSETKTISDKKVKTIPWWLVPLAVLVSFGAIYLKLSSGQVQWILALFRRKKEQDKS